MRLADEPRELESHDALVILRRPQRRVAWRDPDRDRDLDAHRATLGFDAHVLIARQPRLVEHGRERLRDTCRVGAHRERLLLLDAHEDPRSIGTLGDQLGDQRAQIDGLAHQPQRLRLQPSQRDEVAREELHALRIAA